jgi:dTDP-4-dehydrorhamnose 3,5-epimerase
VYADERGDFRETWNARDYGQHGLDVTFVQDNLSRSNPRVLRGLHFQNPYPSRQACLCALRKGVRCGR